MSRFCEEDPSELQTSGKQSPNQISQIPHICSSSFDSLGTSCCQCCHCQRCPWQSRGSNVALERMREVEDSLHSVQMKWSSNGYGEVVVCCSASHVTRSAILWGRLPQHQACLGNRSDEVWGLRGPESINVRTRDTGWAKCALCKAASSAFNVGALLLCRWLLPASHRAPPPPHPR